MGVAAARANDQPSGTRTRSRWSVTATVPNDPSNMPITRSPGASPVTSGATSRTTPAPSLPSSPAGPGYMPSAFSTSRKLRPAARMVTRTWPGASGSRTSGQGVRTRLSKVPLPVVSSRQASAPGGGVRAVEVAARASRAARTAPSRRASWVSSVAAAVASAAGSAAAEAGVRSRSTRRNRSGFSDCAERTRPHSAARSRSGASSPGRVASAPYVATTSREPSYRESASQRCTRSKTRWTVVWTPSPEGSNATATVAGTSSGRSSSPATQWGSARSSPTGTGDHSTRNSASRVASRPAVAVASGRRTNESAVATGAPVSSATSRATLSSPMRVSLTRSAWAPVACRETPLQANGSCPSPVPESVPQPRACRAASSRAGWRPYRSASAR